MPRVKIDLPQKFIFKTELNVRVSDINYGGHLGNDSVLSICHEARMRFLHKGGFTEKNIDGIGIIMVDAAVQYKSESFYGDELEIELTVDDLTNIGCDFVYRITNNKTAQIIAIAKTGIVFFDYEKRKICTAPKSFREYLERIKS